MASFKELTLPDGEKIVVNMEKIRTMQRYCNSPETRIAFAHEPMNRPGFAGGHLV